jgi:magnesium and cobalt exporter, CNNM family
MWADWVLALVLLAGNAFFVGAEFALISARRAQIETIAEQGSKRAKIVLDDMSHLSLMLAGSQLGITVCSLGLGAVAEPALAHALEGGFADLGLPSWFLHPVAFAIALSIVVFLHMVLGEMVPKNIAIALPERSALVLGPMMAAVVKVLRPVIWFLNELSNVILRKVLHVEPQDEVTTAFTSDEFAGFLTESRREGKIDSTEADLLTHALELEERTVVDVMIPLDEVVTVPETISADELERVVARYGFSRYPVRAGARNDPDDSLIGFVHAKDTLAVPDTERDEPLPARQLHPLLPIPTDTPLLNVLAALQWSGGHLATVIADEDRVIGVIALEDVVATFVGDVDDAGQDLVRRRPARRS